MSTSLDNLDPLETGEKVLEAAVAFAEEEWQGRLIAAFALGSLAHGGFSVNASDIDLGLVLNDPLEDLDTARVAKLSNAVAGTGLPLAGRLSVFWGSVATLSEQATGGRFPPLDRLDLIRYGRLLKGRDIRDQFTTPSTEELVIVGAEFALGYLSKPEVTEQLKVPKSFAESDLIPLTKRVLFPVRFFFTAGTGEVGMNDLAVEYFCQNAPGPAAHLARTALGWRSNPPQSGDPDTANVLEEGLLPLYLVFLDDYEERLRGYGRTDLVEQFREWKRNLTAG